jgi:hypothetical protein
VDVWLATKAVEGSKVTEMVIGNNILVLLSDTGEHE